MERARCCEDARREAARRVYAAQAGSAHTSRGGERGTPEVDARWVDAWRPMLLPWASRRRAGRRSDAARIAVALSLHHRLYRRML